jgi:DUF438 domain-containing protein
MDISADTKIGALLAEYAYLLDFLIARSDHFENLKDPTMREAFGKVATLGQVATMHKMDLPGLVADIVEEVRRHGGTATDVALERQEVLKGIIRDLHGGESMEVLKARFRELVNDVSPADIAATEQKLIEEGLPEGEVRELCDVHVEVFKEALERHEMPGAPSGHPVHTFMKENRAAEAIMSDISLVLDGESTLVGEGKDLPELLERLSAIDLHYLRKENQLFPALETAGVSGPSKVMWAIHDTIRDSLKAARQKVADQAGSGDALAAETASAVRDVLKTMADMVFKEENILFPMALETLSEADWVKVREGEEEIGYAWIEPDTGWELATEAQGVTPDTGTIRLDTGFLSMEQVNLLLKHLPVDITVVDENDRVAYYSKGEERIFSRSPGIIGRKVQNCHPPDSVHVVNRIVEAFRQGTRDTAEFWITLQGRFIHIRYFVMRSEDGVYKGCVEVSQNVTGIRELQGQRRLLDWE